MKFNYLIILSLLLILLLNLKPNDAIKQNKNEVEEQEEEEYTDESDSTTTKKDSYYDENEENGYDENEEEEEQDTSSIDDEESSKSTPYNCPSDCKCIFNKVDKNNNEETEEEFESSRKKRLVVNNDEDNTVNNDNNKNVKYEIQVDCSANYLSTIVNLFDYDFPLNQIVSFNLSSNRFRKLKLSDGFEDLINIRTLDLSSNNLLEAPSPKYFLKKFHHLESIHFSNLNQIKCNKMIKLDCKWFKTLVYLYKRNVTVILDNIDNKCNVTTIINNLSLMSRCYSDNTNLIKSSSNSNARIIEVDNNNKFEFTIEPDMSQLLFEGDPLELTCRLKRISISNSQRNNRKPSNNNIRTSIKWMLNERQQITSSTIYHSKDLNTNPTNTQIFETRNNNFKISDSMMESKLLITNSMSLPNSGKYSCMANIIISNDLNNKKIVLNTSQVDIRVLNKNEPNLIDSSTSLKTNTNKLTTTNNIDKIYCPEIITQTYKGIYKWPKTMHSTKMTQKCAINLTKSDSNYNQASFECMSDGKWSTYIDLTKCPFESNLTRYLENLTTPAKIITKSRMMTKQSNMSAISVITLEELIHNIVSIQSKSSNNKQSINMYDIIFIQKFLLMSMHSNKTQTQSSTWRHQFMWLNDMLSKLNEYFLIDAQSIDSNTFSNYFFECIFGFLNNQNSNATSPTAQANDQETSSETEDEYYDYYDQSNTNGNNNNINMDDVSYSSSYLASFTLPSQLSASIILNSSRLVCNLDKYDLTQQIHFSCNQYFNRSTNTQTYLQTKLTFDSNQVLNDYLNRTKRSITFVLFENDKLFPKKNTNQPSTLSAINNFNYLKYESNYDVMNMMENKNKLIDIYSIDSKTNSTTTSQILAFISSNRTISMIQPEFKTNFNLSIEVKMPLRYYNLLGLIQNRIIMKTNELANINNKTNKTISSPPIIRIETENNLFDQVFYNNKNKLITIDDEDINITSLNDYNNTYDQIIVNQTKLLRDFRNILKNKWFNFDNYELIYGIVTKQDNNLTSYIEWSNKPTRLNIRPFISQCYLANLDHAFNPNLNITNSFEHKYRFYLNIQCHLLDSKLITPDLTIKSHKPIQFISLRHKNYTTISTSKATNSILSMIDQYARLYEISLDDDETENKKSLIQSFNTILHQYYQPFHYKIIYFSSIFSSILLFISIIIYIVLHDKLLMPRSFYHIKINIWICVMLLIIIFTLGINQINLPHLCLFSGILLHYLTLCCLIWYTLYFYCLLSKLQTLKKRNYNLIFNGICDGNENEKDDDDNKKIDLDGGIGGGGFVPRPVLHLYLFGWGIPLLLCSVIISITKRDYIKVPFSFCFTNDTNILIGSMLTPLIVMFILILVFIIVITLTIRKILNDLEKDTEEEDKEDEETSVDVKMEELNDRAELCQNWANNNNLNNQDDLDLKCDDMIEIKMNPITQKSMAVSMKEMSQYGYTQTLTNMSSMDDNRSMQSAQTSIMDLQHKPQIQLKFSCLCFVLVLAIWTSAALLTTSHLISMNNYQFLNKLFSYIFSILIFVYSIIQFSFYLLSRDDCVIFEMSITNKRKFDQFCSWCCSFGYNSSNNKKENNINNHDNLYKNHENELSSNENINEENNLYFEPSKTITNRAVDHVDHQYQTRKEASHIYDDSKIMNNNYSNHHRTLDESESDENENLHKESICDIMFSAKKSDETVMKMNNINNIHQIKEQSPSTVSLKSSSSPTNEEHTLQDDIHTFINDNSNIHATLAEQEETNDMIFSPDQTTKTNENITITSISTTTKKSHHVRNPSLGNAAQSIQLNNDDVIYTSHYSCTTKSSHTSSKTRPTNGKKPVYVFVDYTGEEKTTSVSTLPTKISTSSINKSKTTKLDDLLNNSCSANTGTAMNSVPSLINDKLSCSNFTQHLSSNQITHNKLASKSNGSVGDSVTPSSAGSSSNLNTHNSQEDSNINPYGKLNGNSHSQINEERVRYLLNSSNHSSNHDINFSQKPSKLYDRINSNSMIKNSMTTNLNGSLLRGNMIRPREIEPKNETSV